jgi:DNA-binding transcriptional LysR family regulator
MPLVHLDDLRTLMIVARSGSVTKAASILRVTQPAATRRIQRLEMELGVALVDRSARPFGLTAAGQKLAGRLPKLLDALDEVRNDRRAKDSAQVPLRLGMPASLANRLLGDLLAWLRIEFPRWLPMVSSGDHLELGRRLDGGQLDFAVMYVPDDFMAPPTVALRALSRVSLVAVESQRRLGDKASGTWVVDQPGDSFREVLTRVLQAAGMAWSPLEVDGIDCQLNLVAAGIGRGIVPAIVLPDSPVRSQLRLSPLPEIDLSVRVVLLYRPQVICSEKLAERIEVHFQRWLSMASRAAPRPPSPLGPAIPIRATQSS